MAVVDTGLGFKYMGRDGGGPDKWVEIPFKDTETLSKGDLINAESGEADLGATGDAAFLGAAMETKEGTDSTTLIKVYSAADAIYAVYDPNARLLGATLDIAGTTGAMTIAASSNADLIVYAPSTADEWTLVMINHGEHLFN